MRSMSSSRWRRRSFEGTPIGVPLRGFAFPIQTRGAGVTALIPGLQVYMLVAPGLTETYSGLRIGEDMRFHTSLPGRPLWTNPCLAR